MSFLTRVIAAGYLSYEAVDWVEAWISDVKKPPEKAILNEIKEAELKPKTSKTMYRGFNQGSFKTIEEMMEKSFGKVIELGSSFTLNQKELSSWSKTLEGARLFAYSKTLGGRVQERLQGFVVEAKISSQDMLLDISKVRVDSALKEDVRQEKEIIVLPCKVEVRMVSRSKKS